MKGAIVLGLVGILGLVGLACGGGGAAAPTPTPGTRASPTPIASPAPARTPTVELRVIVSSRSFTPSEIRVKQGDVVRLLVSSRDIPHSFVSPDLGIDAFVERGGTTAVEFEAKKPGTYVFYCGQPGHREQGEEGKLVVE